MKDHDHELEDTLRTLRWRRVSPEFLQSSLDAVLAQHAVVQRASPVHRVNHPEQRAKPWAAILSTLINFVPRPLRWPMAACWLLSLFFRLSTPDPVPASVSESLARLPQVDPAVLLTQLDEQHRLLADLIEQLHRRHADPAEAYSPGRSPLP